MGTQAPAAAGNGRAGCSGTPLAQGASRARSSLKETPMKKILIASMAACIALATGGCAVTSGQSTVGQYVDDATIATRVKSRFAEDSQVSAMRIQVEALKGTVQLAGFATSQAEKDRAGQIARATPDVKEVRNNIIVRPATNT
jgi:osmotically-inducible protein OsmY